MLCTIETYSIPSFYAPYLINGDDDYLTKHELTAIVRFIRDNKLTEGHWSIADDFVSFDKFHDLIGYDILPADCMDISFVRRID